jgi:hypothetical protein
MEKVLEEMRSDIVEIKSDITGLNSKFVYLENRIDYIVLNYVTHDSLDMALNRLEKRLMDKIETIAL